MYLYYNKKTPKVFNDFSEKITEIYPYHTRKYLILCFFTENVKNI